MNRKKTKNWNLPFTLFLGALALVYFLKVLLIPSELEKVQGLVSSLGKMGSFNKMPGPLNIASRLDNFEKAIDPEIVVDVSEYVGHAENVEAKDYNRADLKSLGSIYFTMIKKIEILSTDFKKVAPRSYQFVLIAKGQGPQGPFDHAYQVVFSFNSKWKLQKVKVLAPPS